MRTSWGQARRDWTSARPDEPIAPGVVTLAQVIAPGVVCGSLTTVARWEADAQGRLQQAAFELFAERGYDAVTTAEIAERAGLTKRSFFNHFADKREVLFGGSERLPAAVVEAIEVAPVSLGALPTAIHGLQAGADAFMESRRPAVAQRDAIVAAHPELRERELMKRAALAEAIAEALLRRDGDARSSTITARAAILVWQIAMERWTAAPPKDPTTLSRHIERALADLRAATGESLPGAAVG